MDVGTVSTDVVGAVVGFVIVVIGVVLVRELHQRRRAELLVRLTAVFAPAIAQAKTDPRGLVAWAEVARVARKLFPEAFNRLDAASEGRFPFSAELVEAVHAKWTSEWLAWERQHDLEYKRRASAEEAELGRVGETDAGTVRAQLAAIEQEKLQTYQERYEEYVRVGKAIAALEEAE